MAKVIVYNVYTQALETFYLEENDPMPYAYDRTMLVREFRGSSRSSVLWTTNAAMEAWNATRRTYGAPIPFDMHLNESGKADMGSSHSIMQVFPSMWDRH